jgi:hypothetical protein
MDMARPGIKGPSLDDELTTGREEAKFRERLGSGVLGEPTLPPEILDLQRGDSALKSRREIEIYTALRPAHFDCH